MAPFRMELKRMEREGGIKSVKEFARKMKKERREGEAEDGLAAE